MKAEITIEIPGVQGKTMIEYDSEEERSIWIDCTIVDGKLSSIGERKMYRLIVGKRGGLTLK